MDNDELVRQTSQPLASAKGWLTFLGVLSIVYGVLWALTLVGLLVAWIPIWLGVLLLQAGGAIEAAQQSGDPAQMMRSLSKLRTYFVIWGVLALIGLILTVLGVFVGLSTGVLVGLSGHFQSI